MTVASLWVSNDKQIKTFKKACYSKRFIRHFYYYELNEIIKIYILKQINEVRLL